MNLHNRKIHWFKWWFSGARSLIVSPIALFLIFGCIATARTSCIQTYAYFAVTGAVWSKLTWILIFFPVIGFCSILPPYLYWSCFRYMPELSQNETKGKFHLILTFIISLVIAISIATFFQYTHGNIIGWIADLNPDAAFEVGVTGSIPPTHLIEE
jgi:hypothetical protein